MDIECSECKALHWLDERKPGPRRSNPKFHGCCKSGAVSLPPITDPPAELRELYTSNDQDALQFRKNIRHYNGAFAFTSANYKTNSRVREGFGPFQIQGELYHLQGPLEADNGVAPQFAQVWIYDPEYGNDVRCSRNSKLVRRTVDLLTDMLHRVCFCLIFSLHPS
jgi:hypothetical protein